MEMTRSLTLAVAVERWPIAGHFTISRGAKTEAVVVVAELSDGVHRGRGECVPYARYGESVDSVGAAIAAVRPQLAGRLTRAALQEAMPAGAARNAIDCALWDLDAKRAQRPVHALAGLPQPGPVATALTISLDRPDVMAEAARKVASRSLLKIKLGADGDAERIAAVRTAAPKSTLIVDANEGWDEHNLAANLAACARAGVALIEQPLPEGRDQVLAGMHGPITICADESAHVRSSLPALAGRYGAVNVKLDKAGGLTEAFAMIEEAHRLGLTIMVGSMVSTSLGTAPAVLAAQGASYVDLDGPLLLARDREPGLVYRDSMVLPPLPALWG